MIYYTYTIFARGIHRQYLDSFQENANSLIN